jgi:DNA repair exonuclease SbcCD ATPase subunit
MKNKFIFFIVTVLMSLPLYLHFTSSSLFAIEGQCIKVQCFDGSIHDCGFDCSTLVPGGGGSGSGGGYQAPAIDWQRQERIRREQERVRRELERQQKLRRQLHEAEEEAMRREIESKEKFNIEKNEALNSLKGTGGGTLSIKGSGMSKTLGIKAAPDVELKTPAAGTRRITKAWKQLHCGSSISGYAMSKANPKEGELVDVDEVRYLTGQAEKALAGEKIGVQCPEVPALPEPYGKVALGSDSSLVKFYRKILAVTNNEAEKMWKAEREIWDKSKEARKIEREVQEIQQGLDRLKKDLKKNEETPNGKTSENREVDKAEVKKADDASGVNEEVKGDTDNDSEIEKKKRALAEALAALKKAKQARSGVESRIESAKEQIAASREKHAKYEEMFDRAQKEPQKAGELLEGLGKTGGQ